MAEEQQTVIDDNKQEAVPGALNIVYCEICTFPPEVLSKVECQS